MGLQKNIAGQKWRVFAFNKTNGNALAGDAANITAKIAKDWAAAAATNDVNPTETEDGYYLFDLTQAESNADALDLYPESSISNIQVIGVPGSQFPAPANFPDLGIETDGDLTKVNTLNLHTAQTGDGFARLGAPAGASVSADIADVPTVAELNARTLVAASYFDPAVDAVATVTAVTNAVGITAAAIDAIWDELMAGHVTADSAAVRLKDILDDVTGIAGAAMRGTDGVDIGTHAALVNLIWNELTSEGRTAGSYGQLFKDNIDAVISTLALASALATAQADLDKITGSDGVTLATAQALYAPAKAGDAMDLVTDALDALAIEAGGAAEMADKLLGRSIAGGADGGRTVTQALRALRNRWTIVAGTLTVFQENDTTADWTAVVTTTAGDPITEVDPA